MKGFVLAAGFGTRLSPLTNTVPKPLFPVGNAPLIAYALRLLAHHGITEVVVNLHHLGKLIKESLGDGSRFGVNITYSEEPEILGTGGGLKKVHHLLEDDTFVVLNSDTIIDVDLSSIIAEHKARGALATMVLRPDPGQGEYGQIEVDEHQRMRRILGHGKEAGALRSLMFTGVHVVEPRFLEYIPPDVNTCVIRYGYTKALNNDEPLFSHVTDGYWVDAGTPQLYFDANMAALDGRMRLEHCDPLGGLAPDTASFEARLGANVTLGNGAHFSAPVAIGDGAKVFGDAALGPNVLLAPKAHIGRGAELRECIVLEGAKVEARAKLSRCIIGKKATVSLDERPAAKKADARAARR